MNDIPLTAATSILHQFVKAVQNAESDDEIEKIFDQEEGPAFDQLIHGSQWNLATKISISNRETLLHLLIYDELVTKREKQLKGIREGLKVMNLFNLVTRYKQCFRATFVASDRKINPETLISLFDFEDLSQEDQELVPMLKEVFSTFTDEQCENVLKFCTGHNKLPTYNSLLRINVEFMEPSEGIFPKANACINTLRLPKMKDNFKTNFLKALELEGSGFGEY